MHSNGNRPTCQFCGKYGQSITTCWHRFNENFMPQSATTSQPNPSSNSNLGQETPQDSSQNSQDIAMMATTSRPTATTQEYSLPTELKSQAWFTDSGASHHLTPYDFHLRIIKSYVGSNKVYVGNR